MRGRRKRIGDVLLEGSVITPEELERALQMQRQSGQRLGEVLVQHLGVSKTQIAAAIEQVQGVAYAECPPESVSPECLALIPRATAVKCQCLPLQSRNNVLVVAMAEPQNLDFIDEIRFRSGKHISPCFSYREDIQAAIRKFYDGEGIAPPNAAEPASGVVAHANLEEPKPAPAEELKLAPLEPGPAQPEHRLAQPEPRPIQPEPELCAPEAVVVQEPEPAAACTESPAEPALTGMEFVTHGPWSGKPETTKEFRSGTRKSNPALRAVAEILLKAAEKDVTDLHLDPQVHRTLVKIQEDGTLRELRDLPADSRDSIVAMIKALSGMNGEEQLTVQNGSFQFASQGRSFEDRVSVLPAYFGEKVFLRVVASQAERRSFMELGFDADQVSALENLLKLPQGMILVAGPPGSGRTSVLSAALHHLQSSRRTIVTIEDMTERVVEDVTHIQLGSRFDQTVAGCLRSVLRQNPDVIMLGDLRDATTAELALRASRRGRLVLAALLADDSADAISRLRDFGLPQSLVASVDGIVSPRIVRTRCSCRREAADPTSAGKACPLCRNTGYHGNTGTYEVLAVDGSVRSALEDGASLDEIRDILRGTLLRTLHEDAMEKVVSGITTLDEVLRVLPRRKMGSHVSCQECSEPLSQVFRFCPYCGCPASELAALTASGPTRKH